MPAYQLNINGEIRDVDVPEDMPLLWVLRDVLKLTGTKYGCGVGQCRACTVHVDGNPIFSCQLRASSLGTSEIVTIEGLPSDQKEPLVAAWEAEDVPQCGYCQPGQIMSAAALLVRRPLPTDADIDEAMSPNLCRCGTYVRIRKAIHRAAEGTL
jgi:aerobic-type carbon monoxide dehydrogenase small subunit (CoxS/CutS family)